MFFDRDKERVFAGKTCVEVSHTCAESVLVDDLDFLVLLWLSLDFFGVEALCFALNEISVCSFVVVSYLVVLESFGSQIANTIFGVGCQVFGEESAEQW